MKMIARKIGILLLTVTLLLGGFATQQNIIQAKNAESGQQIKAVINPSTISLGKETSFEITQPGQTAYAAFTPSVDSTYNFYARGDESVYCSLYSEEDESYRLEYDYGTAASFNSYLESGVKYIIKLEFSSNDYTGDISLLVRAVTFSVSFNNSSATLSIGNTLQLSPTISPDAAKNNELRWRSSNTNVLTVSNTGLVTAISEGYAYVYAKSWDDEEAKIRIEVVRPYAYLNYNSSNLYIGQSFNLRAYGEYLSISSTTYSTSNKAVATVDSNGKVTAKKPGSARITVSVKAGNKNYTLACNVRVLNPYLSNSKLWIYKNRTAKLAVKYASGKAVWSSSNSKVCTVSKGKLKAKKKGKAVIRCKVNGVTLKCNVTVMNPYLSTKTMELTSGFSGNLYVYRGTSSTKGIKWTSTNKKVATVKKGVVVAKRPGKTTIKCKVDGVTVKCKVIVYKNVYTNTPMRKDDLQLDRIYYQVVKEYFSGNKLKVKVKICNTYTDRKIDVLKVIYFSQDADGGTINKRVVNKKVKLKAYSAKTFTFTIAKGKGLKKRVNLREGSHASMDIETDYYNYQYTY